MVRRQIFVLIILLNTISGYAQNITFSAGLNVSSINIKYYDLQYNTDNFPILFPDLMIGYEHRINKSFSLNPGIWLSRQGKRVVMDIGSGFYYEEKFTISYFDIPLLITYHANPRNFGGYNFTIGAGPYLGYGFKGLVTSDNTAFISEESLFLGEADIKRSDLGYLLVASIGYSDNQIGLFVSGGLKNLAVTGGPYTKFKRISAGVNYIRIVDFSPNARRLYKKRFFK
jgi:hypothetical protein